MSTINLEWDANALAAPQSFRTGVQAAAVILQNAIDDPITVNIGIGYGEYDNGSQTLASGVSLGGITNSVSVSYALLKAALTSNESSATDVAAFSALPSTAALNGQSMFAISRAEAKALGALPATDTSVDGYAGFPASFTGTTLVGAAVVELIHAMGLLNTGFPLELYEYTSPGVHLLTQGTAATPAYFSLDGGVTKLASYDVGFDSTLFSTPTNDPFSVPISGNTALTSLDLAEIGAIGFDVTSTRLPATPTITPATTAAGTRPTVTVQNVTVAENADVPVSTFIKAVTVALGDSISSYAFEDRGTGAGHLAIDGIVEPANQWVDALDTQLNALTFVAGSAPGTDTISVYAIDDTTGAQTSVGTVTVTVAAPAAGSSLAGTVGTAVGGIVTLATTAGTNTLQLGAATSFVTSVGTDTILASSGPATITTYGNARIVGSTGALTVMGGPGNDTVTAGPGGLTFTGGTGYYLVVGGGYAATITAGTGGGLFQGGGNATITAGTGGAQNIEFGSNGDQLYAVGPAGVIFGDSGGDPTRTTLLSSAGDTGNNIFFGSGGSGHMNFITGAGNDLLAVGQGTNTVLLGTGTATVLANAPTAGATTIYAGAGSASIVMGGAATDLVVTSGAARSFSIYNDAASTDHVGLVGYGATQIDTALATQLNTNGGSILTLADGTSLAFIGVQHATASLFG